MPAISAGDLTLLRSDFHRLQVYMSVLRPRTLWTARVNDGAITRGEQTIVFDTGAGSAFAQVAAHQTIWVGTAAGLNDRGKVRIKSVASGDAGVTGELAVNDNELDWADDDYLTFLHNYELWAVYPRIDANEVFWKDWDLDGGIGYTDQNSSIYPVAIGGPHQAGFLSAGIVSFDVPVGSSYALASGGTISTKTVSVYPSAGVTVNAEVAGIITVDYTIAGQYWVKITATDNNGKSQITYRSHFVHVDDPSDPDYPFVDFQSINLSASWERGGWQAGVKLNADASKADFPDNTLVVVWQEAIYGTTQKDISLLSQGANIIIAGYLRQAKTMKDKAGGGQVDFTITTIDDMLRNHFMFSISLTADAAPDTWWKYLNGILTTGRILHHIYRWHSTLLHITDFLGLNDDGGIQRIAADLEKGALYTMGDSFANLNAIRAHIVCDKGGRIRMARDVALRTDADRAAATTIATLTEQDTEGAVTIVENPDIRTAFVFVSGIHYDGATANPLGSTAPGAIPAAFGSKEFLLERQMFSSQADANFLSGQIFAVQNNKYPEVRAQFRGNYLGILDIAEQEWWEIDLLVTDTIRELIWTDQKIIVRNITANFNLKDSIVDIDCVWDTEIDGIDGVPYFWPSVPPTVGGATPPVPTPAASPGAIVTGSSMYYLPYSSSTWTLRTALVINDVQQDPFWRTSSKQDTSNPTSAILFTAEEGLVRKSFNAFQTSFSMAPGDPPNDAGDSPAPALADLSFIEVEGNLVFDDEVIWFAWWQNSSGTWRSWFLYTDDGGLTFSWAGVQ